jgi:hypothetical protein
MTRPLLRMILAVLVAGLAGWSFIGQDFVLNPVGEWIPVVSEFLLAGGRPTAAGDPGPPFTRVDSRFPSIPSAWEMLKPLAAVKDKAYGEDEPVISGWRVWTQPDPNNRDRLLSGLEVKRSDRLGAASERALPVVAVERGGPIPVKFKVEIWGRHRLTGRDDRQYFPADAEYQEFMKRKIQVVDFLLAVHKLEGEFGHEHIKNRAQAEPYRVIGRFRGGLDNSLASYEAASYELPATDDYLGELRLEMSLRFPESERGQASAYDVPVKVCLRFICGSKVKIRVISDTVKKVDKR